MRLLKICGAILGVLLLLAAGTAAFIAARFDPNDYKDDVARLFEERTGRTLTLARDLELDFFPWLAVATGAVTIGESPGFPAGAAQLPFATVSRAAARVRLLPLLRRRIEIGLVELQGLELNLARDEQGRGNWQDLLRRRAADAAGSEPGALPAADAIEIAGVRVSDGVVTWRENVDELRYTVAGLDLETGPIATGRAVDVTVSFTAREELGGRTAAIAARAAAELGDEGSLAARAVQIDFTAADAAAADLARGALHAALVAADSAGRVRVTDAALEVALTRPLDPSGTLDITARAAAAELDSAAQTLTVDGLQTAANGISADWELRAAGLAGTPSLQGAVHAAGPAAALLELAAIAPPAGVSSEELGDLRLDARFRIENGGERISIDDLDAAALGLQLRGEGALENGDRLTGRIEIPELVPGAAAQALLRAAVPPTVDVAAIDRFALAARFDAELAAQRASIRELRASVFDADIEGSLEALPDGSGNLYRGTVKTSRFAPAKLVQAFRGFLPETVSVDELGMLALDGAFSFDTATDTVTFAPLRAEVFGLSGSGEVTGHSVSSAARWSGRVEVAPFSPRDLMRRFGQAVPQTSDPAALGRASIATRFAVDVRREQSRFEGLTLELDDSRIGGDFTVDGFQTPRYSFDLAIDRVDADRYLPPPADAAEDDEKTAGDIALPSDSPLALEGRVQVGALRLANLDFQDVATRITLGGGDAKLESARARLYGGEFEGSFHALTRDSSPGLTLQGKATNLALAPLIQALTREPANFSGTGDFELALTGRGPTVIDNVRTAGGTVAFAMRDGAVQGFNLGHTLCAAYNALQQQPGPAERPKATEYVLIQGTATVQDGIAASRDLLARTAFMDITGAGTLALAEQRLDYDLDARLTGKIDIPGCQTMDGLVGGSIPFNIRGTVSDPTITPDFSEIIKRRIESELRDRVQDRLQDRLRDLIR